jgi:hypothetical protein
MKPVGLTIKGITYLLRNKYPKAKLVYKYLNREITWEVLSEEAQKMANNKLQKSGKKKLHPLQQIKYRRKFKIK